MRLELHRLACRGVDVHADRDHGREVVAAVAAESPAIAKQALKKIKVVYEPLPVVIDPEEATKPNAPVLHDDKPLPKTIPADAGLKNICGHTVVHVGDPEKAMAEADIVVDEVYETKMIHPQYLEPRIAAAQIEPNGRLTVWANAQAPFPVRQEVAKTLGLPLNHVRVISAGLGGGFGGKGSGITSGAAIEPICGLLAIKAKRPVMIVLDKAEETISTTIRAGAKMYIKTGVKKDGTIVARTRQAASCWRRSRISARTCRGAMRRSPSSGAVACGSPRSPAHSARCERRTADGPHSDGGTGPKRTTEGVPSAVAR